MMALRRSIDSQRSVGFVPTMGALHHGHLQLMERARKENDYLIISVFVNPTQFGPNEDFDMYPRQLERDVEMAKDTGVDFIFAPMVADMYPSSHRCYVVPDGFDHLAEGNARPGHFRGVATIVTKLFGMVQPTKAYFGQKDAMQCVLVRRLVEDLNLLPKIVVCPTIREDDGLAMSSRNAYLGEQERQAAPVVYRALQVAQKAFKNSQEPMEAAKLREIIRTIFAKEPLVESVEYVSVARKDTMEEIMEKVEPGEGAIISLALRLGKVRLIDNIIL